MEVWLAEPDSLPLADALASALRVATGSTDTAETVALVLLLEEGETLAEKETLGQWDALPLALELAHNEGRGSTLTAVLDSVGEVLAVRLTVPDPLPRALRVRAKLPV